MTESQQHGTSGADGADGAAALLEEIRLLVAMVVEHALPWLESLLADGHGESHSEGGTNSGDGSAPGEGASMSCDWCPLCAVVSLARGHSPELAVRVLDQASQVVALLRAVLADRWQPDEGVHMPGFRPPSRGSDGQDARRGDPGDARGRVQHIPVHRRDDRDTEVR